VKARVGLSVSLIEDLLNRGPGADPAHPCHLHGAHNLGVLLHCAVPVMTSPSA